MEFFRVDSAPRKPAIFGLLESDQADEILRRSNSDDVASMRDSLRQVLPLTEDGPSGPRVRRISDTHFEVDISSQRKAVLLNWESWHPRWTVTDNGSTVPLIRVFHLFRGVELQPGAHRLEFRYRHSDFDLLLLIAFLYVSAVTIFWTVSTHRLKRFR
jgi:hypothetical protein